MNIDFNIPIERQSTAALRHLESQAEKVGDLPPLAKSIALRGIRAEIKSRSHLGGHAHNPVIIHH